MNASPPDLSPIVEQLRRKIGQTLPPRIVEVEKGAIAKFARAIGETDPLYFDEAYARTTRFGGIIAPPTYLSCLGTELMHAAIFDGGGVLKKKLHGEDVVENGVPLRAGDVITLTLTYADVYAKAGRSGPLLFEVFQIRSVNQRDEHVATVRTVAVSS